MNCIHPHESFLRRCPNHQFDQFFGFLSVDRALSGRYFVWFCFVFCFPSRCPIPTTRFMFHGVEGEIEGWEEGGGSIRHASGLTFREQ